MRDAHQMLANPAAATGSPKDSAHVSADAAPTAGGDMDALPTLPFDGSQLRAVLRSRITQQTSPPLVPTRDSVPPPMILAEEPLPLEPLPPESLPEPRASTLARRWISRPAPRPSRQSASAPVDAMSLATGYRRAPSQSLADGMRELSHPPRARNPALGRAPVRARQPSAPARAFARAPDVGQAPTSLDLHGSVTRLADLPPIAPALAHAPAERTAQRAAQMERRTTLMMLTAIAALLVSLMALLR